MALGTYLNESIRFELSCLQTCPKTCPKEICKKLPGGVGVGAVTVDVVAFDRGVPHMVVADDMPVPDTMITFGFLDLTCDEAPRDADEDAVRANSSGTLV